jgi:hypothetical protein
LRSGRDPDTDRVLWARLIRQTRCADSSLLLESSPGITGKILRIDGIPNGQATSRETAG